MNLPPGLDEAIVLESIERSVRVLAPAFTFGCYDADDIAQLCRLFGLEALKVGTYDPSRPLDNYIYRSIKNRLINYKRDHYRRVDAPCKRCHSGEHCTGTRQPCEEYERWSTAQQVRADLRGPAHQDTLDRTPKERRDHVADVERAELLRRIDEQISLDLRADYLRIRSGIRIPKHRRLAVEAAIRSILGVNEED